MLRVKQQVSDRVVHYRFDGKETERLDKYLAGQLQEFSRSRIQGLISDGFVEVDGHTAKKAGQPLDKGANISVRIPPALPTDIVPEHIPLEILFENTDLIVIDKPAGMVVHPSAGHSSGTLVNAVLGYDSDIEGIGGEERPGVVHRLDKDTSGLIVMAKNERALRWLQEQFRSREVEKAYLALVDGHPPTPSGRVEAAIGRDFKDRKRMAIVPDDKGREAVSEYQTIERFENHTLLEFHPHTGRTHQIRLHCAFLKCPIAGDKVYGHKKSSIPINRHFLHAHRLKIILPGDSQPKEFKAPLPTELETVLYQLRK